jgi:hypothetical protein
VKAIFISFEMHWFAAASTLFVSTRSPATLLGSLTLTRKSLPVFATVARGFAGVDASVLVQEELPPSREAVFDESSAGASHPCVSCGACCAFYRASFPYFEVKERGIPAEMVVEVGFPYVAMKGTHHTKAIRCTALQGEVGKFGTLCGIYEARSSSCRNFWPTLEDGKTRNEYCDKARVAHGLLPLQFGDWLAYLTEIKETGSVL